MKKTLLLITIGILLCLSTSVQCACSDHYTCGTCAAYEACYWCSSSQKCEDYYEEKFSDIICPKKWVQHQSLCPQDGGGRRQTEEQQIMSLLKDSQQSEVSPVEALLGNAGLQSESSQASGGNNQDLKDLLRKLLLLKLLRKIKSEGTSSLNAQETQLLNQLTNLRGETNTVDATVPTTTTTTTTTKTPDVSNEIKQLLSILQNNSGGKKMPVATAKTPTTASPMATAIKTVVKAKSNKTSTTQQLVNLSTEKPSNKSTLSIMSLLNKVDEQNAGVIYEENKPASLDKLTPKTTPVPTTKSPTKAGVKPKKSSSSSTEDFCNLYEEIGVCNSDRNCTWCNTRDTCIRRSSAEYKGCVDASSKMKDDKYGLDICLAAKQCKTCVQNDKCYWCDVSKSCHTYPFFGYVPPSCGGDWYVKQCDVQLAVIIIVLPLIIILLAMVTFYFCLKYCYYRRKVLRVPLFEKPGVFDYRKDKKVYYVNPEDESSDTEMAAEKIRKKYRLPVEREPLIDPNS